MGTCPACKNVVGDEATVCPFCGHGLSKPAHPIPPASFSFHRKEKKSSRFLLALLLGLAGGLLVVGLYWYLRVSPRLERIAGQEEEAAAPEDATEARLSNDPGSDFDRILPLTGDPTGAAWNGDQFVIGNRLKPWGFLRVQKSDEGYQIQKVPVTEPGYHQQVGFVTVAWNGENYVGVADGAFFGAKTPLVFTIHDPVTLRLQRSLPAPNLIGGLTWDGEGYWAATRKNTEDSPEQARLYKLDENLNVVRELDPPGVGCQGLAWDGSYLWFVDVFSNNIYVLDVAGDTVSVRNQYNTSFGYLSGIVYDGRNIWITEYDQKRLRRLSPKLQAEWTGLEVPEETSPVGIEVSNVALPSASHSDSYENSPSYPTDDTEKEYDAESGENIEEDVELASSLEPGTYRVELFIHVQYVDENGTNRILNRSAPTLSVTSD
jgi:hypothetical protein